MTDQTSVDKPLTEQEIRSLVSRSNAWDKIWKHVENNPMMKECIAECHANNCQSAWIMLAKAFDRGFEAYEQEE